MNIYLKNNLINININCSRTKLYINITMCTNNNVKINTNNRINNYTIKK